MTAILNVVRRVEAKVDKMRVDISERPDRRLQPHISIDHPKGQESHSREETMTISPGHAPNTISSILNNREATPPQVSRKGDRISFSQHAMLSWPAIQNQIPQHVASRIPSSGPRYAVDLETSRPSLPMHLQRDGWLESLPVALLTDLSEAFFATFNPNTPVMERGFYFTEVLSVILREGFGYTVECCIVLTVLALGCLGIKGHEEGNFPMPSGSRSPWEGTIEHHSYRSPEWAGIVEEDLPGLRFFNEARRRSGVIACDLDIYAGQYFLLSA